MFLGPCFCLTCLLFVSFWPAPCRYYCYYYWHCLYILICGKWCFSPRVYSVRCHFVELLVFSFVFPRRCLRFLCIPWSEWNKTNWILFSGAQFVKVLVEIKGSISSIRLKRIFCLDVSNRLLLQKIMGCNLFCDQLQS